MSTHETETIVEGNGFKVRVMMDAGSVMVVIDDTKRTVTDDIDGLASVSVYHKDDNFRVSTSYIVRVI